MMELGTNFRVNGLAELVRTHIEETGTSIQAVADNIGVSRTAVSLYLADKYDSDPRNLEEKLAAYLERKTGVRADGEVMARKKTRHPISGQVVLCPLKMPLRSTG